MINKLKDRLLIKKIFILMLVLQPLLNLDVLYSNNVISLFKFSPATIIRVLMILMLVIMVFLSKKINKSDKCLLIYALMYVIFIVLHHFNAISFTANITGEYKYSLSAELFYLFRMFIPILIIYVAGNININKRDIRKIVKIVVLSFSIVIIISNIFKFGIKSYGSGIISHNIFSWFCNNNADYSEYLTVGLFIGTNKLGTLLLALLPLSLYYYLTEENNSFILIVVLQIVALIMIGTRIATYGFILVVLLMFVIYLYISLIRKNIKFNFKKVLYLVLVCVFLLLLVFNSPMNNRKQGSDYESDAANVNDKNNIDKSINDLEEKYKSEFGNMNICTDCLTDAGVSESEQKNPCTDCSSRTEIIDFIENNSAYFYINEEYIYRIYDYRYDYLFWIDVMRKPFSERSNGRKIQQLISNRIFELNNNKYDKYFGIGYSRFKNSDLYLEKDGSVQYFTCGIVGVALFLIPYILPLLIATIYIIRNIRKKFDFDLITYCFCLCVFLLGGYLGGHVLDEMVTYTFMSLFSALILKHCLSGKKDNNMLNCSFNEDDLISVIIPAYNVEKYLDECIDSVINQKNLKCKLEIIVVNDGSSDKTGEICKKYQDAKKIKFINNKKNKGQAYSRNIAIKKSKGNFIVFVDSDDLLYEDSISKLYEQIKVNDADIVISRLNAFDSKGEYGYYSDKYIDSYNVTSIYESNELINCISVCSKIYKSEIVKKNRFLENTLHEDNSFTIELLFSANKIVVYPEYLYHRRYRESENKSTMQKLDYKTFSDLLLNYYDILDVIDPKHNINFLLKYMIQKMNNYLVNNIKPEKYANGKQDIKKFIGNIKIGTINKFYLRVYNKLYYSLVMCYKKINTLLEAL